LPDACARAQRTHLVLITDLYEGGNAQQMLERVASLKATGVQLIVLVALTDEGKPASQEELARKVAALGCVVFACTPDLFPDLMAAALKREDIRA